MSKTSKRHEATSHIKFHLDMESRVWKHSAFGLLDEVKPTRRRDSQNGFTLIELLLVVVIIVILAGLLFPSFAGVRSKAKEAGCFANLKQNGMAMFSYAGDYSNYVPFLNCALSMTDQNYHWITNIYIDGGYLPNPKYSFTTAMPASGVWLCPTIDVSMISNAGVGTGTSYGYNSSHVSKCGWNAPLGMKLSDFKRPSAIVYAGDATMLNNGTENSS